MVTPEHRKQFLEELQTIPIPSVVCKRVGISKATIYRWLEEDKGFKRRYDRAIKRGRDTLVDHAESKLVKLIDKEHFGAIKYFLDANAKRYYKPRKPAPAPKEEERVFTGIDIFVIDSPEAARKHAEREAKRKREEYEPPEGLWDALPP